MMGLSWRFRISSLPRTCVSPRYCQLAGSVAGAGEARLLDEGFQQHGAIGVAGAPVLGQASTGQGEHTRGEIRSGRVDQALGLHTQQDNRLTGASSRATARGRPAPHHTYVPWPLSLPSKRTASRKLGACAAEGGALFTRRYSTMRFTVSGSPEPAS